MSKKDENWPYGDDPNVAEFPGLTESDIKTKTHEITLTVRQKKIVKNVPNEARRS